MADLYRDFVFTRCTTPVGASDVAITVEDVSLFPSNALLAKSEFFVAFESSLSYPHTFEICRVVSVNTSTKTLNVLRAQGGTTAQGHAIVTYIKGTLSSDMLRRARQGFAGSTAPSPDSDVFVQGDRYFSTNENKNYAFTARAAFLTDTFTRAASATTLGSTEAVIGLPYVGLWQTPAGVWGINASGQAYYVSGAVSNVALAGLNVGGLDFDVQFDVYASTTAGSDYGVYFRANSDLTYGYYLQFNGTTATLYRVNAGAFGTTAQTTTYTTGTPHTWRVTAIGNAITVYRDGTSVITYTEAVAALLVTAGNVSAAVGMRIGNAAGVSDTSLYWDNFKSTFPGNTAANTPTPQGWAAVDSGVQNTLASVESAVTSLVQQLDDAVQADANVESTVLKHDIDLTSIYSTFDDLLPVVQQYDLSLMELASTGATIATQVDEIVDTLKASVSVVGAGPPGALQAAAGTIYSDSIGKILYYYSGSAWVAITYSGPGAAISPITYVGSTVYQSSSYPNVVSFPAGTQAGDIAIVFFACGQTSASYSAVTGWTLMFNVPGNYNYSYNTCAAYYRVLTSADITAGSGTFTQPTMGGVNMNGLMRVYRNCGIDVFANTGGISTVGATQTESAITTTAANDFIVHFFDDSSSSSSIGGIGAWANNPASSFNFQYTSIYGADEIQTAIGASTQRTYTLGGTSNNVGWNSLTVALKSTGTITPSAIYSGAGYPTIAGVQGSLYYDTASQAVYVYDTIWLGVNVRVVNTSGDYTAKGNDHILATTTNSGRSSTTAGVDLASFDTNIANPATITQTTTKANDLIVALRTTWNVNPTGFSATLDGSSMTRRSTSWAANIYFAAALFTSDTLVPAASHTISYSGGTAANTAFNSFISLTAATTTGATYFTSDRNGNISFTLPATGPGIVVFYAATNPSTPTMTSGGALTWTSRGSAFHSGIPGGSQQWTAPYTSAQAGTTISIVVTTDSNYGTYIGACFPGTGDPTAYDAANYTLITLPANARSARVTVQSNDLAGNEIRVAPASGTINGSATDSLLARYLSAKYVSDGTNWFKETSPSAGGGGGGTSITPVTKTAAYTAVNGNFVLCNAATTAFTVTLPTATTGNTVTIKKTDSSSNAVTVTPASGTVDGVANVVLSNQYDALALIADGTNWWLV